MVIFHIGKFRIGRLIRKGLQAIGSLREMIFDFIPADRFSSISNNTMNEEFRKFSNRVYSTECARFEGYRRMKRRKLSSTVSLALLSLSIIAFNIVQLCDGYENYNLSITAVTIMLSVLVLVLSLLVSYLNYSEREMKYYDCGLKLSALCDEIDLVMSDPQHKLLTNEALGLLKDKYQRIIGECGINHIEIDHKRAEIRIEKKEERKQKAKRKSGNEDNTDHTNSEINNKNRTEWSEILTYCISPDMLKDLKSATFRKLRRMIVWIEWNIFDVNFLYWLLAFGIPLLAWWIIFRSSVFPNILSTIWYAVPV